MPRLREWSAWHRILPAGSVLAPGIVVLLLASSLAMSAQPATGEDRTGMRLREAGTSLRDQIDTFEFSAFSVLAQGNGQEGRTGRWLALPIRLAVVDSTGAPVPGAAVEFWVEDGAGAEVEPGKAWTDSAGGVAARIRLGKEMKKYVVSAAVSHPGLGTGVVRLRAQSYDPLRITPAIVGGLGLFLYGIITMSVSLQKVAGQKMKSILKLLTSNRFVGVGVGTFVTGVIQSSSATSVMVVGLVNAGLLTLQQAIGVVIGANIGTTITGQLIAFRIDRFALPLVGVAVAVIMLSRRKQMKLWGEGLLGFALLFLGLSIMTQVLTPLSGSELARSFFVRFSEKPILGVMAGMVATMIIQSSSATVGLTQALGAAGLIDLRGGICLVLGENIGTTITAQIAACGSGRMARRAATAHTMFNVLGVVVMLLVMYSSTFYVRLVGSTSTDVMRQIANSHTLFNVLNAVVWIPLVSVLRKIVERMVPGAVEMLHIEPRYLEKHLLGTPLIAIEQAKKEIVRMAEVARDATREATRCFFEGAQVAFNRVHILEDGVDNLQGAITHYLVEIAKRNLTEVESEQLPVLLHTVNDLERIGDHAENIVELAERRKFDGVRMPEGALDELRTMAAEVDEMADCIVKAFSENDHDLARRALKIEDRLNRLHIEARQSYAMRLGTGQVQASSGLVFFDMVMNYEKMGDHYTNIAQAVLGELQWDKGVKVK